TIRSGVAMCSGDVGVGFLAGTSAMASHHADTARAPATPLIRVRGGPLVRFGHARCPRSCMDAERDGLRKVRRAAPAPRLTELERLIREQLVRVKFMREMGYSAALAEERLKVLEEVRQDHLCA